MRLDLFFSLILVDEIGFNNVCKNTHRGGFNLAANAHLYSDIRRPEYLPGHLTGQSFL
jgi:hypothetical protein